MKVKVIQIHKTDRIENIKILYRKSTKSHYYIHGSRSWHNTGNCSYSSENFGCIGMNTSHETQWSYPSILNFWRTFIIWKGETEYLFPSLTWNFSSQWVWQLIIKIFVIIHMYHSFWDRKWPRWDSWCNCKSS